MPQDFVRFFFPKKLRVVNLSFQVRSFFLPFDDPRTEFKPLYSRPKEPIPDWEKYYYDFIAVCRTNFIQLINLYVVQELTVPAVKPRIWQDDGSIYLGRLAPDYANYTTEQILAIPTFQGML